MLTTGQNKSKGLVFKTESSNDTLSVFTHLHETQRGEDTFTARACPGRKKPLQVWLGSLECRNQSAPKDSRPCTRRRVCLRNKNSLSNCLRKALSDTTDSACRETPRLLQAPAP